MSLPTDIDATYANDPEDDTVQLHQEYHDALHSRYTLSDTAANLASENPVLNEGQAAHASDTQEMAVGDGSTAWADLPKFEPSDVRELASAESSTEQTGIGDSPTDITGLQIDFDVGSRPVLVRGFLPWITGTDEGTSVFLYIAETGGSHPDNIIARAVSNALPATLACLGSIEHRFTTSGSYSLRLRMNKAGSGTVGVNASGFGDEITCRFYAIEL